MTITLDEKIADVSQRLQEIDAEFPQAKDAGEWAKASALNLERDTLGDQLPQLQEEQRAEREQARQAENADLAERIATEAITFHDTLVDLVPEWRALVEKTIETVSLERRFYDWADSTVRAAGADGITLGPIPSIRHGGKMVRLLSEKALLVSEIVRELEPMFANLRESQLEVEMMNRKRAGNRLPGVTA
jgi:hypothetical protein